ncbi:hypothetical protein GCM10020256_45000 [Streptomyces thermocoprophilus]
MAFPVAVLPVKLMAGTSGESMRAAAASRSAVSMLRTPGSRPSVCVMISVNRRLIWAVCSGSLTTAVQPAARAGARERMVRMTGEFHGVMTPATPRGSRTTIE